MQCFSFWETNNSIISSLRSNYTYDRGLDYLINYPSMLQKLTLNDIQKAATKVLKPKNLTWVIVGDKQKIEKGIQELNLGVIKYIDSEGKEIK